MPDTPTLREAAEAFVAAIDACRMADVLALPSGARDKLNTLRAALDAEAAWRARAEAAIALAEAYAQYGEYAHYEPDADEYPMHIEELYRREDALVAARRRYEETCRG